MDGTKKLSSRITPAQPRGRPQFEGSDILSATDPILPAAYSGYCNIDGVDHPVVRTPAMQFRTRCNLSPWRVAVSVASELSR